MVVIRNRVYMFILTKCYNIRCLSFIVNSGYTIIQCTVGLSCNLFFRYYGHIVLWHRDVSLYSPQSVPGDTDYYSADIQDYSLYSRYLKFIYTKFVRQAAFISFLCTSLIKLILTLDTQKHNF